jgi:peroxiredoxin
MPDLVLPTVDGTQTIALSQFRGQKVLLIVFASW